MIMIKGGILKKASFFPKDSLINYVFFATFFFIVTFMPCWAECNKTLVNGWGESWEPFIMGAPDNSDGFDMEILEAVVTTAGCGLEHTEIELPWKRHLKLIETGQIDLATAVSWNKERAEYAYYTLPYRSEYLALYVRKGEPGKYPITKFEDLLKLNFEIGTLLGVSYGNKTDTVLKKLGERNQIVPVFSLNHKKLVAKRIDGYLSNLPDEPILLKEMGLTDKIEQHPMPAINTGDIHIILSKKNNSPEVFEALNDALIRIKTNGTYSKIVKKYSDKYGVSDW